MKNLKIYVLILATLCFAKFGWDLSCDRFIIAGLQLGVGMFNLGLFFKIELQEFINDKIK